MIITKLKTLADALPREIERCMELLAVYDAIPQGAFGAACIRNDIRVAHKAMMEGDLPGMISAYKSLKEID